MLILTGWAARRTGFEIYQIAIVFRVLDRNPISVENANFYSPESSCDDQVSDLCTTETTPYKGSRKARGTRHGQFEQPLPPPCLQHPSS